jgi:transcriptional regulator with XRE-family HTH domain
MRTYTTVAPSPAGRRLAAELRRIREGTGLNGEQAAKKMGWSPSKVSRQECGESCIRPADVTRLLKLYKVAEGEAGRLSALGARAWDERGLQENDRFSAIELLAWAPLSVPVILRSGDYLRAVLVQLQKITPVSPGMIRDALDRNVLWQARLRDANPIRVQAVLDESVLLRRVGGSFVMREQVRYLAELAGRENVDLRVLPLSKSGPSHLPSFTFTRFGGDDDLPVTDEVEVATLADPWHPASERDVWLHYLAFEQLYSAAEPAEDHLKAAMAAWPDGPSGGGGI